MASEIIFNAIVTISHAVMAYAAGGADPDGREALEVSVGILRDNCPADCSKTILSLSSWLDILYSAHRHQRYRNPVGTETGAEIVKRDIYQCLDTIERRVKGY